VMTTTTQDSEIMVQALPFDGTQEKFLVWRDKFEAIAQAKGYWLALENDPDLPTSSDTVLDPNVTANVLGIKALKCNDDVMATLVVLVTDTVIGQLFVGQSKSKDFLRGIVKKVWKCLKEHYTPKDGMGCRWSSKSS
jgi:hypothetical protein